MHVVLSSSGSVGGPGGGLENFKVPLVAAPALLVRVPVKNFAFGRNNPLKISPKISLVAWFRGRA
jgi:hypothetical protein